MKWKLHIYFTLILPWLSSSLILNLASTTFFTSRWIFLPKSLNMVEPPDNTMFYKHRIKIKPCHTVTSLQLFYSITGTFILKCFHLKQSQITSIHTNTLDSFCKAFFFSLHFLHFQFWFICTLYSPLRVSMGQCCITVSTTSEIGVIKSGLQNYNNKSGKKIIQTLIFFFF